MSFPAYILRYTRFCLSLRKSRSRFVISSASLSLCIDSTPKAYYYKLRFVNTSFSGNQKELAHIQVQVEYGYVSIQSRANGDTNT